MKKEIGLVIPTSILGSKGLKDSDKLVFGLHYAYFKKMGITAITQKKMGEILHLHPNMVSKSNKTLVENQLIQKAKGGFEVVKTIVDQLQKVEKTTEEIILPFEVYSKKLNIGAMLLWGEYNRYRDTEKGYFVEREKTARFIGSSEASVSNWTTELYENGMLEEYTVNYGEKGSERIVRTKNFNEKEE